MKRLLILLSIFLLIGSVPSLAESKWLVQEKNPPKNRNSFILSQSGQITSLVAKGVVVPEPQDDWLISDTGVTKVARDSTPKIRWIYHYNTDSHDVFLYDDEHKGYEAIVNTKTGIKARRIFYEDSNINRVAVEWNTGDLVGRVTLYREDGKETKDIRLRKLDNYYLVKDIIYDELGNKIGQDYHSATGDEIKIFSSYIKEKGWAK